MRSVRRSVRLTFPSLFHFVVAVAVSTQLLAVVACNKTEAATAASAPATSAAPASTAPGGVEKCEHGVQKEICARCNPALKPAFVAKNDWCAEHERPESQCALCHSDLAKAGVKP